MQAAYKDCYGHEDINNEAVTTGKSEHLGGICGRK
jgi:hypothetical protein